MVWVPALSGRLRVSRKVEERLLRLAQFDALTGLPNRHLCLKRFPLAALKIDRSFIRDRALLAANMQHWQEVRTAF